MKMISLLIWCFSFTFFAFVFGPHMAGLRVCTQGSKLGGLYEYRVQDKTPTSHAILDPQGFSLNEAYRWMTLFYFILGKGERSFPNSAQRFSCPIQWSSANWACASGNSGATPAVCSGSPGLHPVVLSGPWNDKNRTGSAPLTPSPTSSAPNLLFYFLRSPNFK